MLCAYTGLLFAQTPAAPTAGQAKGSSVSQTLMQMEKDWLAAQKAGDIDKLSQIVAGDWVGINNGKRETRQSYLAAVKSGEAKIESFEIGPMSVKVLGSVAVVQGSDTETGLTNGKDSSRKYVWMDVFVKRAGKWVALRSQDAIVK